MVSCTFFSSVPPELPQSVSADSVYRSSGKEIDVEMEDEGVADGKCTTIVHVSKRRIARDRPWLLLIQLFWTVTNNHANYKPTWLRMAQSGMMAQQSSLASTGYDSHEINPAESGSLNPTTVQPGRILSHHLQTWHYIEFISFLRYTV